MDISLPTFRGPTCQRLNVCAARKMDTNVPTLERSTLPIVNIPPSTDKISINVRESTMVRPSDQTPQKSLWNSNLDLVMPRSHSHVVYYYKHDGSANFFDAELLKDALGETLVPFYPLAGRLGLGEHGRIAIDCNGKGVLFVDAEADCALEDFGEFSPMLSSPLVPKLDYSVGISNYPLTAVQITRFKCGAVSLGFSLQHQTLDATAGTHFIKSWSNVARGAAISPQPFIDRTLIRARDPPTPTFHHKEFDSTPTLKRNATPTSPRAAKISKLRITPKQLKHLKLNAMLETGNGSTGYTAIEALSAHMWRCACRARKLADDQETRVILPVDVRSRFQPPLPLEYHGNAIVIATASAFVGDLLSKPLGFTAQKIQQAVARVDDTYLRSAVDFLEIQPDDPQAVAARAYSFTYPNLMINSWVRASRYKMDFGWGQTIYMGPAELPVEGLAFIQANPISDGDVFAVVSLPPDQIPQFEQAMYEM